MGDLNFISQASFARKIGVSRKTVSLWRTRGLLVITDENMVDAKASEVRLADRPTVLRGGTAKGPSSGEGNASRVTGNALKVTIRAGRSSEVTRKLDVRIRVARRVLAP